MDDDVVWDDDDDEDKRIVNWLTQAMQEPKDARLHQSMKGAAPALLTV
jgi:hypothetical protein